MPRYWALSTIAFFASLGLPGMAGFVSEAMVVIGSFGSTVGMTAEQIAAGQFWGPYQWLVLISCIGIVMTAAYILWAIQRVYLGAEYKGPHGDHLTPMTGRELALLGGGQLLLIGLLTALIALPLGLVLAQLLIDVVLKYSFGCR